jgi:IclR family KDG regulon transcriptional repressor
MTLTASEVGAALENPPPLLVPDGPAPAGEAQDGPLRSVAIAMAVLDCFGDEAELGATKVAQRLGVAKSTACRMLAALASGGLLERTPGGRYRLGLRLFEIGQLAVDRLMLRELSLPTCSTSTGWRVRGPGRCSTPRCTGAGPATRRARGR